MAVPVRKTPSRKWLHIGAAVMLIVIALALIIRALTGSTIKEQKLQQEADRQALELSRKPAPNAESLSVKLEQARSDAERSAVAPQTADSGARALPSSPMSADGGQQRPGLGTAASPGKPTSNIPLPSGGGSFPAGADVSDDQLDAYARNKEAAMRDANRRLAGWEGSGQAATPAAGNAEMAQVGRGSSSSNAPSTNTTSPAASLMETYLKAQQATQNGQSNQDQFKQSLSKRTVEEPLTALARPGQFLLMEGSSWPVVMDVDVSSDIGGPCSAMVARDIYDSLTQKALMIPAGSKVICAYDAGVVQGQERLLIAFTRLILPNGQSVALAGMPGADPQGAIGAPAEVNRRFWKIYGTSLLIAAVSRAAEKSNPSSTVTINATGATAASTAAGVLADTARRTLERNLNIKPELRVSAGDILRVVLTRDIELTPMSFR